MKFTVSWLKQHLDTTASLAEICTKLTALGLEVEGVEDYSQKLAPFIIGHVVEAVPHPNADRLRVCTVDTGTETLQIVCGASNARAGIKIVLARPGDVMPDTGQALKKGAIRGVESQGMMCAVDELGIGDAHEGIIELDAAAPVGSSFAAYAGYDDAMIEINLTPNRPDCAGVRGIARDLAAAGLGTLKPLDTTAVKGTEKSRIQIILDDPACPLFAGRLVRNIKNTESPAWLQQRLRMIGQRPISALVDITTYLTVDAARPLHVFDAKKIKGNLWIRPAQGGESFEALNGKIYTLSEGMTAIGDDTGVLSLGGIMGGSSTACDENTTDVFIEAAYFDPLRIALTGRALQLTSDARYRFERGVDPLFTLDGMEIATRLVVELCGTPETIVSEVEVAGKAPVLEKTIHLDLAKCFKHTGVDLPVTEQEQILTRLGFTVQQENGRLRVTPPSWRPDIDGSSDLIEEIIRVKGYEHLPATSLPRHEAITRPAIDTEEARLHTARRVLAMQGLMEAVTWSFMPAEIAALFGAIPDELRLVNPISSDLDVMRPSLLGNLILAAKRNVDRGAADVALFEVGPAFASAAPEGQRTIATSLRAGLSPRHWNAPTRAVDVFDAKADALAVLAALGVPTANLQITTDAPVWYHPGRSGVLRLGPHPLAFFGALHPQIIDACGASGPMVGCEIFPEAIPVARNAGSAKPLLVLDALQPVTRDFAFLVEGSVTAAKLVKAVKDAEKSLIRAVTVFDVYEGEKVEKGKKSVALSVTLQPTQKTLTDAEIDAIAAKITDSVAKATGGQLRG